jgi:hypothetical protein
MKVIIKIESQVEQICRAKFLKVNLRIISFHLKECQGLQRKPSRQR